MFFFTFLKYERICDTIIKYVLNHKMGQWVNAEYSRKPSKKPLTFAISMFHQNFKLPIVMTIM